MNAVILAGGKGTRLRPYTTILPKPLMPVGDFPILEIVIEQLKRNGLERIVIAVGHLAELIEAYFGDGKKWGIDIQYSRENKPLGTAGPMSIVSDLTDPFLLMNGDILTNLDYRDLIKFHCKSNSTATVALYNKKVNINLGVIETDGHSQIRNYIEKPKLNYQVSMGIYAFSIRVLEYLKINEYQDIPNLIQLLIRNGEKVLGYPFDGYWFDIGTKEDYEGVSEEFDHIKSHFL